MSARASAVTMLPQPISPNSRSRVQPATTPCTPVSWMSLHWLRRRHDICWQWRLIAWTIAMWEVCQHMVSLKHARYIAMWEVC